jgi:hypothetical protein
VRVVGEGLSTSAKPEVGPIDAVSDMSADVLEAGSNFACFSAGRRIRFSNLGVLAFVALGCEGAGRSNRGVVAPTATNRSMGLDGPTPNGPNRGVKGALRKQAMPHKYRETGQWLVSLASGQRQF